MAAATLTRGRLIGIIAGVILGLFLAALDQTIVSTALPRIVADLNGLSVISWVVTAYLLTSTVTVPLYGKLSDLYGRKTMFLTGMIIFLIGSMLSGLSQTIEQLIIFRAIQGLGAGAMFPIAFAIIGDLFTPAERAKYQGMFAAIFGLSSVIGPAVGGWITDNLSWHWVFYVNVPIGAVAITVVAMFLPNMAQKGKRHIDYFGAAALTTAVVPLLLAMVWGGGEYAWGSWQIIGLLAVAAVMTGVFIFIESRATEPILPLSLFRNRVVVVAISVMALVGMAMFGAISYIPLFIQGVLGESATNSGTVLTPMMFAMVVTSVISGQIVARTGRYKILTVVGPIVITLGMFLLGRISGSTTKIEAIIAMIAIGIGLGVAMPIFQLVVQNAVDPRMMGAATSAVQFFRQIGGTVGVAIFGSLLTNSLATTVPNHLDPSILARIPADRLAQLTNPQILLSPPAIAAIQTQLPGPLVDQILSALRLGLVDSLAVVFTAATIVSLVAVVISIFLKEIPLRKGQRPTVAVEGAGKARHPAPAPEPASARILATESPVDQPRRPR